MNSKADTGSPIIKARKVAVDASHPSGASSSGPTTFFLKSERELEKSLQTRRKSSRSSTASADAAVTSTSVAGSLGDSQFGVQSLEETIASGCSSESDLSQGSLTKSMQVYATHVPEYPIPTNSASRKRKVNPVHPKILATGQRIISSEWVPTVPSGIASPSSTRSSESPFRAQDLRKSSVTSSVNLSQPLTPVKMSPHPQSATPITPRSTSPKSFRLSDDEASNADDTTSQALESSSGDEEEGLELPPQLVMPSLAMPARRPFTELGRQIGRAKILVLGPSGVGKTSFIYSAVQSCEHIVHVDPASDCAADPTRSATEILASTRPLPPWWTERAKKRARQRRKSTGDGALERNLTFIDTPGLSDEASIDKVMQLLHASLQRAEDIDGMSEDELLGLLSGEGSTNIDMAVYIFPPELSPAESSDGGLSLPHQELLRTISKYANFIPLIGRADLVAPEVLRSRKQQVLALLETIGVVPINVAELSLSASTSSSLRTLPPSASGGDEEHTEPFSISSAPGDDTDIIDASLLMSSQYMKPLVPSELDHVVKVLLQPASIARMRHLSALKFVDWRREKHRYRTDLLKPAALLSPVLGGMHSPGITSTGSLLDEPSKVMVPYGSSSYFRSHSPTLSDHSMLSHGIPDTSALARYTEQSSSAPAEPFRQVRLAKWAQDLQRSLANERERYHKRFHASSSRLGDWALSAPHSDSDDAADATEKQDAALVTTDRPPRGRLGGALAVIDPRDPLGVLAFTQALRSRGIFALQIASGCGLAGAMLYWLLRNTVDVQAMLGFGPAPPPVIHAQVVGPPAAGWSKFPLVQWLDQVNWRGLFRWEQ